MRKLMHVGAVAGGLVGWWAGAKLNVWMALAGSGIGGLGGIWITWRLLRDYM
jgi:hypothetical protein